LCSLSLLSKSFVQPIYIHDVLLLPRR